MPELRSRIGSPRALRLWPQAPRALAEEINRVHVLPVSRIPTHNLGASMSDRDDDIKKGAVEAARQFVIQLIQHGDHIDTLRNMSAKHFYDNVLSYAQYQVDNQKPMRHDTICAMCGHTAFIHYETGARHRGGRGQCHYADEGSLCPCPEFKPDPEIENYPKYGRAGLVIRRQPTKTPASKG